MEEVSPDASGQVGTGAVGSSLSCRQASFRFAIADTAVYQPPASVVPFPSDASEEVRAAYGPV